MKLAVIAEIDLSIKKGLTNYVHTKAHHLKTLESTGLIVDFYIIRVVDTKLYSLLHNNQVKTIECDADGYIESEGIQYKVLYVKRNLFHALYGIIFKRDVIYKRQMLKLAESFKNYDAISSHWTFAHYLAYFINKKYGIPYTTTWHGSDINVYAMSDKHKDRKEKHGEIFENAKMNFFVSKALAQNAQKVSTRGKKTHIYTGAANEFYSYPEERKRELRKKYGVLEKKVIAFSGNLVPVKNPIALPEIFNRVYKELGKDALFWVIGDGNQRIAVEKQINELNLPNRFFGNVHPKEMPDLMNCIDVLVAPSINEGVSLVLQEIRACGGYGVGSKIGGIPEVIGDENCFEIDNNFAECISNRIIDIIKHNEHMQPLPQEYSWDAAVAKELKFLS